MKEQGWIKTNYPPFEKNGDLAELIGVVLGDGYIGKFPRTEILAVFSNANNLGFVSRYISLIERVFQKKPTLLKKKDSNCIKISFYQKYISKRLGIPTGSKRNIKIEIA